MATPATERLKPLPPTFGSPVPQVMPGGPTPQTPQTPQTQPQTRVPTTRLQQQPGMQPYTATDNLRGTQINPTTDPRTAGAQASATDAYGRARTAIGAANPNSAGAGQARTMALGGLQALQGPDRGAIATDVFQQIRDASEPQFQKDLQGVGQKAAALGRLGAGMTTSELGDVVSNRERDLSLAMRGLSSDAASQSLNDRLGVFNAQLGASGQFTQEDLARAGFGLQQAGAEQSLGTDYANMGDRIFGQGLTQRNELRGERDFQNNMQQQSVDDYIRQRSLEEMLLQGEHGRNMDVTNTLLGYGYGG